MIDFNAVRSEVQTRILQFSLFTLNDSIYNAAQFYLLIIYLIRQFYGYYLTNFIG